MRVKLSVHINHPYQNKSTTVVGALQATPYIPVTPCIFTTPHIPATHTVSAMPKTATFLFGSGIDKNRILDFVYLNRK